MARRRFQIALLGAGLVAGVGAAAMAAETAAETAATTGGLYDPAQLPTFHGTVAQYDLTPRGDVDGLILADGTEVHLRPDLGGRLTALVHPGDQVTIHGLKARVLPLVQAMSVTRDAGGGSVVDDGPFGGHPQTDQTRTALEARGPVRMALHGPRGDLNGVVLQDGTQVHLPPREAARLSSQLAPGQMLLVRGEGIKGPLGEVISADAIGPDADHLTTIAHPPRPPHPHHPGEGPDRGPGHGPDHGPGPDDGPAGPGPGPGPGPDGAGPA